MIDGTYFGWILRTIRVDWRRELIKGTKAIVSAAVLCRETFKICVAFSKKKSDQSPTQQEFKLDIEANLKQ